MHPCPIYIYICIQYCYNDVLKYVLFLFIFSEERERESDMINNAKRLGPKVWNLKKDRTIYVRRALIKRNILYSPPHVHRKLVKMLFVSFTSLPALYDENSHIVVGLYLRHDRINIIIKCRSSPRANLKYILSTLRLITKQFSPVKCPPHEGTGILSKDTGL